MPHISPLRCGASDQRYNPPYKKSRKGPPSGGPQPASPQATPLCRRPFSPLSPHFYLKRPPIGLDNLIEGNTVSDIPITIVIELGYNNTLIRSNKFVRVQTPEQTDKWMG